MPQGEQEWIVVLECAGRGRATTDELMSVVASLAPLGPTGVPGPDRYALQVHVVTATVPDAMRMATNRWEKALSDLGLPAAGIVRAEVLTPEEFAWERGNDLATVPPLTGLVPWEALRHQLEYSLAGAPDGRTVALVLVEADGGQDVDRVARRVQQLLRSGDVVARLSGSVFAVLLDNTSEQVATAVARRLGEALPTPPASAAVGIALSEPGDHGDALIARARTSLRRAAESVHMN